MRPYAGTVGRAVFRLVAVFGGRRVPASMPGVFAAYSDNGLQTMLRYPRSHAGAHYSI
jgi:hypothetical protein